MTSPMIPAQAVDAAIAAWSKIETRTLRGRMYEALEAAAPHIAGAWHDAVSEAYVEGALSLEQASVMWAKNPYRTPDAR